MTPSPFERKEEQRPAFAAAFEVADGNYTSHVDGHILEHAEGGMVGVTNVAP